MIELHIFPEPHDGKESELEPLYCKKYVPGIKIQEGFNGRLCSKNTTPCKSIKSISILTVRSCGSIGLTPRNTQKFGPKWPRCANRCLGPVS
jgi:hypothetical protein